MPCHLQLLNSLAAYVSSKIIEGVHVNDVKFFVTEGWKKWISRRGFGYASKIERVPS